jgi:hypothetical protein
MKASCKTIDRSRNSRRITFQSDCAAQLTPAIEIAEDDVGRSDAGETIERVGLPQDERRGVVRLVSLLVVVELTRRGLMRAIVRAGLLDPPP